MRDAVIVRVRWALFAGIASLMGAAVFVACRFTDDLTGVPPDDTGAPPSSCDADITTSVFNCGACGHVCESSGESYPTCAGGHCQLQCGSASFGDCDDSGANGCETDLRDAGDNCGACGHGCLGGACSAGVCQPLALMRDAAAPVQIVQDQQGNVFGIDERGTVTKTPKDGGAASILFAGGGVRAMQPRIAISQQALYYTDVGTGAVWTSALDGGGRRALASASAPNAVAVAGGYVYWSEGNPDADVPDNGIRRCAPGGAISCTSDGGVETVLEHQPGVAINSIVITAPSVLSPGKVYWTNPGTHAANFVDGKIQSCDLPDAGPATPCTPDLVVPTATPGAFSMVSDGNLYYSTSDTVAAFTCNGTGGCSSPSVAVTQFRPRFVTFDPSNRYVFWTTGDGAIRTELKGSWITGETTLYQRRQTTPLDIVVDGQAIYWTDTSAPKTLYKLAR